MKSSKKKELFQFISLIGIGGIISKILAIPHSIIFAKLLMPSGFGLLQLIKVIVSYVGYTGIGISQGMNRNVPRAYANKEFDKVKKIKDLTFTWLAAVTLIAILSLWVIFIFSDIFGNRLSVFDLVLITLIIILGRINAFVKPLLKAEGQFIVIGKTTVINNTISPILGIILVILFNLTGAIIALTFSQLITFISYTYFYRRYIPKIYINWALLKEQMSSGLLIFIGMFSTSLIINFTLILIGYFHNIEEVGIFSFGLISLIYIQRYSGPIGMYFYRDIMMLKDGDNKNNDYYKKLLKLPYVFSFFFNTFLLGLFSITYFTIINLVLDKYFNSIPVIYISLFGLIIYNSRIFLFHFLDATNQLARRTAIIVIGSSISLLLTTVLLNLKYPIYYVAYSCSAGFILITLGVYFISVKQIFKTYKIVFVMLLKVIVIALINSVLAYFFSEVFFIKYVLNILSFSNIAYSIIDLLIKLSIFILLNYFLFSLFYIQEKFMSEFNKNALKIVFKIKSKFRIQKQLKLF
ncbi:hypothetical protein EB822_10760 [Flavobacteriaceae bacterium PRS1]|nr:hypothetical protein EB822_10760 [Flavobacteriaceae bacterium PRS1]